MNERISITLAKEDRFYIVTLNGNDDETIREISFPYDQYNWRLVLGQAMAETEILLEEQLGTEWTAAVKLDRQLREEAEQDVVT